MVYLNASILQTLASPQSRTYYCILPRLPQRPGHCPHSVSPQPWNLPLSGGEDTSGFEFNDLVYPSVNGRSCVTLLPLFSFWLLLVNRQEFTMTSDARLRSTLVGYHETSMDNYRMARRQCVPY